MREKSFVVWLLLIALLLLLVINPLARLLWASFQHPETGAFTLANYVAAYGRWRHVEALINSLVIGLAVAALCTVFGVPMAWAVSRTDMPGKGLVWAAVLGTFIMPNYLGAVAWILMAGPNAGWLNRGYTAITAADAGPFNVYSKTGLVLVIACYSFPYMFVFTRSALDLISSEMEDAASTLGAGALRTTLRVTLPRALPAILGAFIVEFLESIALFGAPALIALPARFQVMTTMLWQMFEFPPRVQEAAAYAMPLLLVTVFLFWLQYRIIARKGYVALTGKGGERRLVRLGPWRFILLGHCLFVTSLSFFLPMLLGQRHAAQPALRAVRPDRHPGRHPQHLRVRGGGLGHRAHPRARHRLHRGAPPGPARPGADLRGDGSLRHPGHRARDRVLRRLHHEAARALRHRVDPHPRLRDALPPHRVHQQRRGAPQHQPGAGGRGPHPGRRQAPVPTSNSRAPPEARARGRLHPGVHPGHPRAVLRDLPLHHRHPGAVGPPLRQERRGQLRGALLHGPDPGGGHGRAGAGGLPDGRPRLPPPEDRHVSRLVLTDVSRRFGTVTAAARFSLTLQAGEFVSLLGPSGCGKTTTLRMIAGFLEPSEGTIDMDGRRISAPGSTLPPEKRNMSMIFQSYAIWPNMTGAENVAFGLEVRRGR